MTNIEQERYEEYEIYPPLPKNTKLLLDVRDQGPGRFWEMKDRPENTKKKGRIYASVWFKTGEAIIRPYLAPYLKQKYPDQKIFIQLSMTMNEDEWITLEDFLSSNEDTKIQNKKEQHIHGQIIHLQKWLHSTTGKAKEKFRNQIRRLQNRLGAETSEEGEGSEEYSKIAGDIPIAQLKAQTQTSESLSKP